MPEPIKRKVRVLKAEYVKEADSIIFLGECKEGRFRQQLHSSCFYFGDKDKEEEMKKLALIAVGKNVFMIFDTELDGKIQDHVPLKY